MHLAVDHHVAARTEPQLCIIRILHECTAHHEGSYGAYAVRAMTRAKYCPAVDSAHSLRWQRICGHRQCRMHKRSADLRGRWRTPMTLCMLDSTLTGSTSVRRQHGARTSKRTCTACSLQACQASQRQTPFTYAFQPSSGTSTSVLWRQRAAWPSQHRRKSRLTHLSRALLVSHEHYGRRAKLHQRIA